MSLAPSATPFASRLAAPDFLQTETGAHKLANRETISRVHHSSARRISRRDDALRDSVGKDNNLPGATASNRRGANYRAQWPDDPGNPRAAGQLGGASRTTRHARDY